MDIHPFETLAPSGNRIKEVGLAIREKASETPTKTLNIPPLHVVV